MTEMVFGTVSTKSGEPIISRWWRTVDRVSLFAVVALFAVGILLGLAASPPLAERNGLGAFHSGMVQETAYCGCNRLLDGIGRPRSGLKCFLLLEGPQDIVDHPFL